jgi:hypothetical protein
MIRFWSCLAVLLAVSAALVPVPALAEVPAPKDEAGFFSADALQRATERVKGFETKYQLPVLVETFAAIPDEKKADVDLLDIRAREKLFAEWGRERLKTPGLDGVGILLCKEPAYVFIALGEQTRQTRLTPGDRRTLVSLMINRLVDRRYDDALFGALDFIEDRVELNLQKPPAEPAAEDDTGAGGEATPLSVFGPRARVTGIGMRGIREGTPPPPPPQNATLAEDPEEEESLAANAGLWLLLIAGGALALALVLLLHRWLARSASPVATEPATTE